MTQCVRAYWPGARCTDGQIASRGRPRRVYERHERHGRQHRGTAIPHIGHPRPPSLSWGAAFGRSHCSTLGVFWRTAMPAPRPAGQAALGTRRWDWCGRPRRGRDRPRVCRRDRGGRNPHANGTLCPRQLQGILLSTPPLNVQVLSVGGQSLAPHSGPEGTVLVATADMQSRLAWTTFSAPPALGTSARPEADSPSTGGGELGRGTAGDSGKAEEAECSGSTGACSQVRFGWYSEYSIGYSQ